MTFEETKPSGEQFPEAFKKGEALGQRYGADNEKAWRSGHRYTGSALHQDHLDAVAVAQEGMSDEEKAAFQRGYNAGEKVGKDRESAWHAAQADK